MSRPDLPDPGAAIVIGQAIERLAVDYDVALGAAGGDESVVTMYLPGEWSILARRVFALIAVEVAKRAAARDSADAVIDAAAIEACSVCTGRLWFISRDPFTLRRNVRCAGCGTVSHV